MVFRAPCFAFLDTNFQTRRRLSDIPEFGGRSNDLPVTVPLCVCMRVLSRTDETMMMLNADMLPKLNYVSMSWNNDHHSSSKSDVRSQADMTTVVNVVNAAAVKYLSDRQLVQQALAATNRAAGRRSTSQHGASTSSDASVYGVRSTELSLASKKYFEKHHLAAKPVQSAGHRQQQRSSQSRIEDLLNSISSQVNGLQMTMSDCKHSPSPSSMSAAVNVDDDMLGGGGRFDNSASSTTRRRSDGVSSVAGDSSQSFPGRIRHDRKSVNSSRASLDESWTSEWMHYQMHHH